jgi:LPXTG-motif cell wall-anchored protein
MDLSTIVFGALAVLFGGLYFVRRRSRMGSDAWE